MDLCEAIKAANNFEEKAKVVWEHYQSRRLNSDLEPKWTHAAYESVAKVLQKTATPEEKQLANEIIASHALKDGYSVAAFPGMPSSPLRIIHDGWKSGTPTWIFMGRSLPGAAQDIGGGWVAVQRTLPPELYKLLGSNAPATLWIAYNLEQQMGTSALTSNCIGPAYSLQEVLDEVAVA